MPTRTPRSYDEIVRGTVVEPDSSFRPTKAQVAVAGEQFQAERAHAQMTDQERALYARLAGALLGDTALGEFGFEVEHGRVTLHGSVGDASAITELEARARSIEGVDDVVNQLVVRK